MKGIALDSNRNFRVVRGDFFIPESTDFQDAQEVIYANKGNLLQHPTLGVGIIQYSNSPIPKAELERNIRKELQKDGVNLISVSVKRTDDDEFEINIISNRPEQ